MSVVEVTSENFETEVVQAKGLVLIDFWAAWCGPCQMLSPVVDEVAKELTDVKVCKVNVDEANDLAQKFRIMSIPSLVLTRNGEMVNKSVGVIPKDEIIEFIKSES